jgi:phosphoglycerate dehydrogenase-like enzyme
MKVLVLFPSDQAAEYAPLEQAGHQVVFGRPLGDRRPFAENEVVDLCRDVDGVITVSCSAAVMAQTSRLRAVIAPIIGIERVDLKAATRHSILACNSPAPENFKGVAASTVGYIFMLGHRQKHKEALLRAGRWGTEVDRGQLLVGKSVGFVGLGRTASEAAKRLRGWEMRLIAYDPYVSPEIAALLGVELVDSLETLLRAADYVSLHLVVTDETRHMIGERELRMMKPTAYLINTSRGEVLDEVAFCQATADGWIAGGALDVYHQEPLALSSPLRELDPIKVILTPHNISHSPDSAAGGRRLAVESMLKALAGEVPEFVMNPEVIPAWKHRFGHR